MNFNATVWLTNEFSSERLYANSGMFLIGLCVCVCALYLFFCFIFQSKSVWVIQKRTQCSRLHFSMFATGFWWVFYSCSLFSPFQNVSSLICWFRNTKHIWPIHQICMSRVCVCLRFCCTPSSYDTKISMKNKQQQRQPQPQFTLDNNVFS